MSDYMMTNNNNDHQFEQKSYIESINDNNKIYKLKLNVADFEANDLKIELNGLNLTISGYYQADTVIPQTIKKTKQFKRDIQLPNFIDINKLNSYVASDEDGSNILTIEAPVLLNYYQNQHQNTSSINKNNDMYERLSTNRFTSQLESNEISSGVLKYKFSLKEYRPQDISICIKDGRKLYINAVNESFDHYGKMLREFVREINLPQDVNPYKIKNCYDPIDGILRIEIPLENISNDNNLILNSSLNDDGNRNNNIIDQEINNNDGQFEKMNLNDNHLELSFDFTGYELNNVKILQQNLKSKILQLQAAAAAMNSRNFNSNNNERDCEKKVSYLLPNWVDSSNYKVYKKTFNNNLNNYKNIIVVKLPILKQYLAHNNYNIVNNYERNVV